MRRFILLSILLVIYTITAMAQKPKPVKKASGTKSSVTTGSRMLFKDLAAICNTPEGQMKILQQRHFVRKKDQEFQQGYAVTDSFYNNSGDELTFVYDPYEKTRTILVFQTPSAQQARQLISDALKSGYRATDSVEIVAGNNEESYLTKKVIYTEQPSFESPPPYPGDYALLFAASEAYTENGKRYLFTFSAAQRHLVVEPNPVAPGGPQPVRAWQPTPENAVIDTLTIEAGKPVLLFAEIGNNRLRDEPKNKDSLDFFKKRNFFYNSFKKLTKAYPEDQYRYINLYRPTLVRYGNDKRQTLPFFPGQYAPAFVFWGGKKSDIIVPHNSWQDAYYIVSNATGDNQARPGYARYRNDSLEVARLSGSSSFHPSPRLLQYMDHFISYAMWQEGLLPLSLLNLTGLRIITASNRQRTMRYYFNRQGQLDSLTSTTEDNDREFRKSIIRRDGIPVAACINKDTSFFSYSGDTLIVSHQGYILRYLLQAEILRLTDHFETREDNYLSNNIREYVNDPEHIQLQPLHQKDAEGNLTLDESSLYMKTNEGGFRPVQSKYFFRKGVLQRVELSNTRQNTGDQYYVFIDNYN